MALREPTELRASAVELAQVNIGLLGNFSHVSPRLVGESYRFTPKGFGGSPGSCSSSWHLTEQDSLLQIDVHFTWGVRVANKRVEWRAHRRSLRSHRRFLRWHKKWVKVSVVCAGEYVGFEEIDDGVWNVCFGPLKLGRFNERIMRIEDELGRLYRHDLLNHVFGLFCYLCPRSVNEQWRQHRRRTRT